MGNYQIIYLGIQYSFRGKVQKLKNNLTFI